MEDALDREVELDAPDGLEPVDALRALLRAQLDAIRANDPGTRLGAAPESLHDMRVAVRRSRALLRATRELVATDTQMLAHELRWLGGVLGDVRDLDVLLDRLGAAAAELEPDDGAAAARLLDGLERRRVRARRTLLKALDGERYAALLDHFEATLDTLEPEASPLTLDELAARDLQQLRRAVEDAGADPSDETLHDLRKRGKRTRYVYELAGAKKVVARAKAFQDVLGEHQDSVVAVVRLRELSHDASPGEALAAGLLIARERERQRAAREEWPKAWHALAG